MAEFFYELLLGLYPSDYRKKYGYEMRLLFRDLYAEEVEKHKEIGVGFLMRLSLDVMKSTIAEHLELLKKIGLKKYASEIFHINSYFTIGLIAVLPLLLLLFINNIDVLLTGNGRFFAPFYNAFYWLPSMFIIVAILSMFAFLLNVVIIVRALTSSGHRVVSLHFLAQQLPNFIIVCVA